MRALNRLAAAVAATAVLAAPAWADFTNSSWTGVVRCILKGKIVDPVDKADRKYKTDDEQPGQNLAVGTTSFSQFTTGAAQLNGALAPKGKVFLTDEAGFENAARNVVREKLVAALMLIGVSDATFADPPDLKGVYKPKGPTASPTSVKGKQKLKFTGVIAGGPEDGKTVVGKLTVLFEGTPTPP